MQNPKTSHWKDVVKILRYLKIHTSSGMFYAKKMRVILLEVQGFVDSDKVGLTYERRSTSGYCITLGGNVLIWKSKKKNGVARSSG